MTPMERDLLRQAIDAAARARVAAFAAEENERSCAGCGGLTNDFTPGCKRCWERRRQRERWQDPQYRLAYNARRRQLRQASRSTPT